MPKQDAFAIVKEQVRLSSLVKEFTKLNDKGNGRWRGACPIHEGKNESNFSVNDDIGLWKCFSDDCGGGTVIDFWMKINRMDSDHPIEAVKQLAAKYNIALPEIDAKSRTSSARSIKTSLGKVSKALHAYLMDQSSGEEADVAFEWLDTKRSVSTDIIDDWLIGYMPKGSVGIELVEDAVNGATRPLFDAGFLKEGESGVWSPFAGRVMFPIFQPGKGESVDVVGFGGRKVPGIACFGAKFVNSPNSVAYDKSAVLYGLDEVQAGDRVYVVEGYLDVIAVNSCDLEGVSAVAACGTSITASQLGLLKEASEVIILTDGDEPGRKALTNSCWAVNVLGDRAHGAILPPGKDPWDTYVEDREWLAEFLAKDHPDLTRIAASTRYKDSATDSAFDEWVRGVFRASQSPKQRDAILADGARLRGLTTMGYQTEVFRGRAASATNDIRNAETGQSLSLGMEGLFRRILQAPDEEREALFATTGRWPESVEQALRWALPVETPLDIDCLEAVATSSLISAGPEVIAALTECLVEEQETEDISVQLRGIVTLMMARGQDLVRDGMSDEILTARFLGLRKFQQNPPETEDQLVALAAIIDLAIDAERFQRRVDASR